MSATDSATEMATAVRTVEQPGPRRPGRLRRSWDKYWYAWAMVLPVIAVMAVIIGYPLVRGILLTFTDATERNIGNQFIGPSFHWIGLHNYTNILSGREGKFWSILWRTMIWTGACVFFHYTLGLILATVLNRKMRFRSLYRIALILPWAVPSYISAFAWRYIFNDDYGVLNLTLHKLGMPTPAWLGGDTTAFIAVILVNVWLGVPFMMVALLGGLQSIPQELYEAAEVDGASAWQRFVNVTLPGLRSVSMTVILLGIIWTFNMFNIIFLITGGGPGDSTHILVTYAYIAGFQGVRNYALAATYGVLILSLLVVFAAGYRRVLRSQGEVW